MTFMSKILSGNISTRIKMYKVLVFKFKRHLLKESSEEEQEARFPPDLFYFFLFTKHLLQISINLPSSIVNP